MDAKMQPGEVMDLARFCG